MSAKYIIPLSALELAVVSQGEDAGQAIERSVKVARKVESLGFTRLWLAEHHNMEHIASSATSVLVGHIAGKTSRLRVGSGGIMLPNHAPLVIAEQFGTLETIYPGRIDLGLGRAPGTDQLTAMALRRNNMSTAFDFPNDVLELQRYFENTDQEARVRAFPGEGLRIPLYILGSSTDSAFLAADRGLPYAFAAHFAPAQLELAIEIYRTRFRPSKYLERPYMIACVNVFGADTDEEAEYLSTSLYRMFLGIVTNQRKPLQPPGPLPDLIHVPEVQEMMRRMTACTFTGDQATLKKKLEAFIADTSIDELMVTSYIYDMEARLHSYEVLAAAMRETT